MSWLPHDLGRPWPTTADEARAIQDALRPRVDPTTPSTARFRTVAGLDSAYADDSRVATAVVVLDAATGEPVESAVAHGTAAFPYVPGLLAFRELPTTLDALEKLTAAPDLLICDGQGRAHPRRFGLACHLGVLTGISSIGVAKTAWGEYHEPGTERGCHTDITIDGEIVGRALRTRTGVKPVYVSVGHRIDPDEACARVLALAPRYRQPETTRRADQLCRAALRDYSGSVP